MKIKIVKALHNLSLVALIAVTSVKSIYLGLFVIEMLLIAAICEEIRKCKKEF